MTPETIKCLCDLNNSNHLQPGETIEVWFERLTNIAYDIALNPNTSPETLAILAKDSKRTIRCCVATNSKITLKIITILAKDSDWMIRNQIAKNPITPLETLAILAEDSEWGVRNTSTSYLRKRTK